MAKAHQSIFFLYLRSAFFHLIPAIASVYKVDDLHRFNYRLTALWSLSELGGSLLSTLKLPFAGMLICISSVLILSLFYQANQENDKPVAIAFLVVSVMKVVCNPLVSPLAFLALFFQAGFCMVVFRNIRPFERASIVAGVVCLVHTCLQQLFLREGDLNFWSLKAALLPTAIFSNLIMDVVKSSVWLELAYLVFFGVAGWFTGRLAARLPAMILDEMAFLHTQESLPKPVLTPKQQKKLDKKNKKRSNYGMPRFLAVVAIGAFSTGQYHSGLKVLQVAVLWLIVFTDFFQRHVVPRVLHVLTGWFYPQYLDAGEHTGNFGKMSAMIRSAWLLAREENRFLSKVARFVALVFALGLGDFGHLGEA